MTVNVASLWTNTDLKAYGQVQTKLNIKEAFPIDHPQFTKASWKAGDD